MTNVHAVKHGQTSVTLCGMAVAYLDEYDCVDCIGWRSVTCRRCRPKPRRSAAKKGYCGIPDDETCRKYHAHAAAKERP